jgi:hypothetical protein
MIANGDLNTTVIQSRVRLLSGGAPGELCTIKSHELHHMPDYGSRPKTAGPAHGES